MSPPPALSAGIAARVLDRPGGFGLVGNVGGARERFAAAGLDLGRQVLQPVGSAGDQRHLRPGPRQGDRSAPADPRRGAGDQGRLPGKDASHDVYPRRCDM